MIVNQFEWAKRAYLASQKDKFLILEDWKNHIPKDVIHIKRTVITFEKKIYLSFRWKACPIPKIGTKNSLKKVWDRSWKDPSYPRELTSVLNIHDQVSKIGKKSEMLQKDPGQILKGKYHPDEALLLLRQLSIFFHRKYNLYNNKDVKMTEKVSDV